MAVQKQIEIIVDTDKAKKPVIELNKDLQQTEDSIKNIGDNSAKSFNNTAKNATKSSRGIGKITKSVKGLGVAFKALGIGLIIAGIAAITEAFKSNQKVVDAVSIVFETIGGVLSQITNAFVRVYESVSQSTENFDALGRIMSNVLKIAVTPFKVAFFGIKLAVEQVQLAWEKSVFGGKDADKIKQLTLDIQETKKALIEVGTDALQAVKDIGSDVGEAIDEVTNIATVATQELKKVSVSSARSQAEALVQARNNAKLLTVAQQGLIEQYDVQAEKQRQLRDSDLTSISDRIEANNKLKEVLDKQEEAMLKNADQLIQIARLELQRNNTIDNQVALQEALNEKKAVEARIEGMRSEQLTNANSLKREELELIQSATDAETERSLAQQKFVADQITNEQLRFQELLKINELEKELRASDLEDQINNYQTGTQARVDAENALKDFLQQNANERIEIEKKVSENNKRISEENEKRDELVAAAKVNMAQNVSNLIGQIAGKDTAVAKGVAVASATISGIEGVQNAFTTASKSPVTTVFPAYPYVQAGLAGAFSALQIREILKTDPTGKSVSSPRSTSQGQSAPAFNLVQGTETSQITDAINQQNQHPTQAYVVSSEVETQAALDRQIETRASFG